MLDVIENIQYYYECYDGAKRRREQPQGPETDGSLEFEEEECPEDLTTDSLITHQDVKEITEEDIDVMYECRGAMRERLYAEVALDTAIKCGVFSNDALQTVFLPIAENAHIDDLKIFRAWEEQLKMICRREREEGGPALFANVDGVVPVLTTINERPGIEPLYVERPTITQTKRDLLKRDQRRAHDIIEKQLLRRMAGKYPTTILHMSNTHQKSRETTSTAADASTGTQWHWQVDAHRCDHRDVQGSPF